MITIPHRNTLKTTSRFAQGLNQAALGVSRYEPQTSSSVPTDELEYISHQYLRHCLVRKMSPATITMKTYCLRLLLDFHDTYNKCTNLSLEDFSLKLGRGDTVTQNTYLQHIKTFLRWGADEYGIAPLYEKLIVPKRPRRMQPSPNQEHLKLLLKAADESEHPLHYNAMIGLLTDGGLRAAELCALNVADLSLKTFPGSAFVRHGKGDKARIVHFGSRVSKTLFKYIKYRKDIPLAPAIVSYGGITPRCRMTRSGVLNAVKRLAKAAGVTGVNITPHALRRASGIEFLRNGGDMRELQLMYGHEDISTTILYVNQADSMLEEKFKTASPMDNL